MRLTLSSIIFLMLHLSIFRQSNNQIHISKTTIAILGTFHFAGSTSDADSLKVDDMKSTKRQNEVLELVDLLSKFKPTKIIIERLFNSTKADSLY